MALLAGVGPMGLGAIAYALCCDRRPGVLVVTDINEDRLRRAEDLFAKQAKEAGIQPITLGKRILRTETAGMTVLSVLMFQMEQ